MGPNDDRNVLSAETRELVEQLARELIGRVGLRRALKLLRSCMQEQALKKAGGNRSEAARLLEVDRRYVQRFANAGVLPALQNAPARPCQDCADMAQSGR